MSDTGQLKYPAGAQAVFQRSTTQQHPLGARGEDIFGRTFRYAKNSSSATDLVVGNWVQSAAEVDNHHAMVPTATAIGEDTINVTPGNTAGEANLYAGGVAIITTSDGKGYSYPVKGHLAITANTAFNVQLADGWTIQVALTTNSRVSLIANPYKNIIVGPASTMTGVPVGIVVTPLDADEYGWVGVHGLFGVTYEDTPAVGQLVGAPSDTAGQAVIHSGTFAIIGMSMETGVDDTPSATLVTIG